MQRSHCIRLMIRWIWKATIITRVPIRSNPIQSTLGVGRHVLIIIWKDDHFFDDVEGMLDQALRCAIMVKLNNNIPPSNKPIIDVQIYAMTSKFFFGETKMVSKANLVIRVKIKRVSATILPSLRYLMTNLEYLMNKFSLHDYHTHESMFSKLHSTCAPSLGAKSCSAI